MRSRVMDLDQIARDERIVRVCVIQIAPKLRPRNEGVEHGSAGDRRVDGEPACFTAQTYGLVETHQTRWRDESYGWEAVRIACRENNRIRTRERRRHENRGLVDDSAHEIGDERDVETRRVADCGAIGHPETEKV